MTRSMQPTLQAVDAIARRDEAIYKRVLASHDLGYADGYAEGKRHAYRRMTWAMAAVLASGVIVAWML